MSTAWNFASSAVTKVQVGSGIQLLDEEVGNLVTAGLDGAKNLYSNTPIEGQKYYKVVSTNKNNIKTQDVLGYGLAKVNSDGDNLPVDKQIVGFPTTITSYVLRNATAITRQMLDDDRYGVIGDRSRGLMHSGKRTIEYLQADSFNRGFGTTGLSLLCEDGLALFSAGRPQPRTSAGTWSNLDAGGVLTAAAVAENRLAFKTYIDGNGDLDPQELVKVIVSPDLLDTMREISGSTLKVDTNLNNTNVVSGTSYECYSFLAPGTVVYEGSTENGLEFHIRSNPNLMAWNDGSNPDKMWMRWRMQAGTGCKRPGKWRGCVVV